MDAFDGCFDVSTVSLYLCCLVERGDVGDIFLQIQLHSIQRCVLNEAGDRVGTITGRCRLGSCVVGDKVDSQCAIGRIIREHGFDVRRCRNMDP